MSKNIVKINKDLVYLPTSLHEDLAKFGVVKIFNEPECRKLKPRNVDFPTTGVITSFI